jgi:hypothetical protein
VLVEGSLQTRLQPSLRKKKDKVANPDWEDIPFNPVPITPVSSRPRFAQVVGSPSKTMAPPCPHMGVATITATLRPPGDGGGRGGNGRGRGDGGRGRGLGNPP